MGLILDNARKNIVISSAKYSEAQNESALYNTVSNTDNSSSTKYRNTANLQLRMGMGVVIDTIPFNHTYRVSTSLLATPIVCQALFNTTGGYPMAASCNGYPVGADVIIAYDPVTNIGIIMGGYTPLNGLEHYAFRTLLSGVVRRYNTDEYTHYSITTRADEKWPDGSYHAANFAFTEHSDVPEWGTSYITGTRVFTDPYMILIGTDDYTHLAIFNRDSLLRLSAINFQLRTFGREEECLVDNNEYIEYKGTALYTYEHYGNMQLGAPIADIKDRDEWFIPNSVTSPYEPINPKIKPFHRIMEFGGWLGQGKLTQVIPPSYSADHFDFYEKVQPRSALSRMQLDVSGRLSMGTTRGISLTKYGCMPTVERIVRPDEISADVGDNRTNYYHYSLELPKEIRKTAKSPSMQEAIGIMDYSGYNKNWNEIFQLAYHTRDYQVDEESQLERYSINAPTYSVLSGSYLLPEDSTYSVTVDARRTYNEYTENEAGIHILPSGGIVIYDGSGSEIRFVKGQITISCAGDINLKPGRTINLWAGKDIIARANKNIDISSSKSSVRVKAEQNLELLGANSGSSNNGVIIESKSTGVLYDFSKLGDEISTNGIVLKSKNSPVALIGDITYIRCGDGTNPGKGIILDAGNGAMNISCIAKNIQEYVTGIHSINFDNNDPSDIESSTTFRKDMTTLVGHTIITKDLVMDGRLIMAKDIVCCGTITSFGNQSGLISPFGVKTREKNLEYIDKNTEVPEEKYPEMYTQIYTNQVAPLIYNENRIGNDIVLDGISFSFRTDEQLNLPNDYYVYEDLWQHIARNSGGAPNMWEETSVICTTGTTYPFPGKQKFQEPTFVTQETTIADFNKRIYIDRNVSEGATTPSESRYSDPRYGDQSYNSLNEYPII